MARGPRIPHKNINEIEHKYCTKCNEWLSLDDFSNNKTTWDGKVAQCKSCLKGTNRELYITKKLLKQPHGT